REQRGGSGDLQILGERSRRRQAGARSENSFEDPAANPLIDLLLQSLAGLGIDPDEKGSGRAGLGAISPAQDSGARVVALCASPRPMTRTGLTTSKPD